jgi:hypothetical protein
MSINIVRLPHICTRIKLLLVIKIKSNEFKFKKARKTDLEELSGTFKINFYRNFKLFCVPDWLIWISKRAFTYIAIFLLKIQLKIYNTWRPGQKCVEI